MGLQVQVQVQEEHRTSARLQVRCGWPARACEEGAGGGGGWAGSVVPVASSSGRPVTSGAKLAHAHLREEDEIKRGRGDQLYVLHEGCGAADQLSSACRPM